MARATITGKIPGIDDNITVEGNLATEDAINKLIDVIKGQESELKTDVDQFNDSVGESSENLDEFSDELIRAGKNQSKVNRRIKEFADEVAEGSGSIRRFADSGGDMSTVVEGLGNYAAGFAESLVAAIPGLDLIAPGVSDLVGDIGVAVVGLTSAAIATMEGFSALNKSIFNAGLQIEGGFDAFGEMASDASLPINEFANAVIQSRDRLRLFSGGAPGGLQNVSRALAQFRDDGIMENLYSLGFTTEEIVAGMSDYAIEAQRAGRNLSTEELAEGSNQYLRNLRELSRITGVSIQEQQARMDADRADLFIQNALLDVNEEQRGEAAAFAAAIPEALGPIRDFIITGQSFTAESGLMASEMATAAGIYRQAYDAVASGAMTQEQAQEYLRTTLEANADQIEAEAERTTRAFGAAPGNIIAEGEALGAAIRAVREMVNASAATDEAGGTEVPEGTMADALGSFEQTVNQVQSELQNLFFDTAVGLAPLLTNFADILSDTTFSLGEIREMFGEVASGDISGLAEHFERLFGTELNIEPGESAMEALTNAISDAILDGFNRILGEIAQRAARGLLEVIPGGALVGDLLDLFENLRSDETERPDFTHPRDDRRDPSGEDHIPESATGNILTGPASGYLAELHGTEAVVPLPDGRSIPVDLGESNTAPIEMLSGTLERTIGGYTSQLSALSFESLHSELRQLGTALTDRNALAAEQTNSASTDFSTGLDSSRTLSEMLQVNRNMLNQMISSTQKLEQMIHTMERGNTISRNTAYARA